MIYKHKASGKLYRVILESFSVERQRHSVVYMKLADGAIFDRDADAFDDGFMEVIDPQDMIAPRDVNQGEMNLEEIDTNPDYKRDIQKAAKQQLDN